eukprot:2340956-Prymnesium_polylepis.2
MARWFQPPHSSSLCVCNAAQCGPILRVWQRWDIRHVSGVLIIAVPLAPIASAPPGNFSRTATRLTWLSPGAPASQYDFNGTRELTTNATVSSLTPRGNTYGYEYWGCYSRA